MSIVWSILQLLLAAILPLVPEWIHARKTVAVDAGRDADRTERLRQRVLDSKRHPRPTG